MTFWEIKIAALKLMFDNLDDDVSADNVDALTDNLNYRDRLINMPEAINRALDRIMAKKVLAKNVADLDGYLLSTGKAFTRYDISGLRDLYKIDKIVLECGNEYIDNHPYRMEGSSIIVLSAITEGEYKLVYDVKPRKVDNYTQNDDTIRVPEHIARLIPYFIKAELYEEDEPNIADKARQIFENGLIEIDTDVPEFAPTLGVVYRV